MGKKINVGIIFGGKSVEHEVSLQSAKSVYDTIDREKYNPVLIGIDKSGKWLRADDSRFLLCADDPKMISLDPSGDPVALIPRSRGRLSVLEPGAGTSAEELDVVFPILHGTYGEDGTVQGLLKLADVPFVGSSVLGSAVGMDKDVMKRLLRDAGIPIGKFLVRRAHEAASGTAAFDEAAAALGLPFFLKPANMGSSVGVFKIRSEEEYRTGIAEAFSYDTKVILEEYIRGRELECSVLGNEEPMASVPGEVISTHDFYSYDAKYLDEHGAVLEIPAKVPEEIKARVQSLAVKAFQVLCGEGLARVDFFLREDAVFVNEINTMPG
ncbi:MAG: D-alanine--D-alanine ligase, partial [Treponema sp.]|nr:D-alanine--D-alanine ligase [Treponema sp.]